MRDTRAAFARWGLTVYAGLALLGLAGCGSGGTYPVSGKLEYADTHEPVTELAGFTVTFTSQELGKSAIGTIQEDGTFRLTSTRPDDGAFPGHYKVIINQPHPNPERREYRTPVIAVLYEDPGQTTLEADVEAKAKNEFTFTLQRFKAQPGGNRG